MRYIFSAKSLPNTDFLALEPMSNFGGSWYPFRLRPSFLKNKKESESTKFTKIITI